MNYRVLIVLTVLALAGFAAGLAHLFFLRFERGDVYPEYSSLRPDPLGAKGLFDSFAELEGVKVARNFKPSPHFGDGTDQVLFLLGTHPTAIKTVPKSDAADLEAWIARGGRLVVAFQTIVSEPWLPGGWKNRPDSEPEQKKDSGKADKKGAKSSNPDSLHPQEGVVDLDQQWGVTLAYKNFSKDEERTVRISEGAPLQSSGPISWHSVLWFDKLDPVWQVVYTRNEKPAIIARSMGTGSIVWCGESYLFSNEALRNERRAELLSWIAGPHPREIVFDETHLGVESVPSLAMLARKYGLHGILAVLVVLALLFVWKNSVSFLPVANEAKDLDSISGQDSASGLTSLLRRTIAPLRILDTCVQEWKKSQGFGQRNLEAKTARMNEATQKLSTQGRDVTGTYAELCRIAAERQA